MAGLLALTVVFDSLMVSVGLFRYDQSRSLGIDVLLTPAEDLAWPVASALLVMTDSENPQAKGEEIRMTIRDGKTLTAEWTLGFRSDGTFARYYHIDCTTAAGESDPMPTVYAIKIQADQRPDDQHAKEEHADLLLYVVGGRIVPHRRVSPARRRRRQAFFQRRRGSAAGR